MHDPRPCPRCGATIPPGANDCPRCLVGLAADDPGGAAAPSLEELRPHFPQLELVRLIGRGGMGTVYEARHKGLGRRVALKVLAPEVARDPSFAERFDREARALARLSHPGIVAVHDAGRAGEHYFLLLEYVDGSDLRRILRSRALTPGHALELVRQVCDALQYAHEQGVVHRDIKPENILVDRSGRAKIADFGLARLVGAEPEAWRLTRSSQAMGTLHYMAPEQVERPLAVDHRADIYSLGVVFYELLTGELPLGRFQPPSRKVEVDVRLDEVVLHALEKEPERRYQAASAVRQDLDAVSATPSAAGNDSCRRRAARADRPAAGPSWRHVAVGCAVVAVLGVLGSVFLGAWFLEPRELPSRAPEGATKPVVIVRQAPAPVGDAAPGPLWSDALEDVHLSDSLARRLGLEGPPRRHVERVLTRTALLRHELERPHLTYVRLEPDERLVALGAFPEAREAALEELWEELSALLTDEALAALDAAGVEHWLLPFGEHPVEIELRRDGAGYHAIERTEDAERSFSPAPAPLPRHASYWRP